MKIGERLKNLRKENGLTQAELGSRCDLSKGFISQLEADLTSPSLSTLEDILDCIKTQDPTVTIAEFPEDGYKIHWLVWDAQKNCMEPILAEIEPHGKTEIHSPHEGEEFGYILHGSVCLHIGDRKHRVRRGECFYFKARAPHYIENTGKSAASVLWVASPPTF